MSYEKGEIAVSLITDEDADKGGVESDIAFIRWVKNEDDTYRIGVPQHLTDQYEFDDDIWIAHFTDQQGAAGNVIPAYMVVQVVQYTEPRAASDMWRELRQAKIRKLNDLARTTMGITCRLVQTPGISGMSAEDQSSIREMIETYDTFEAGDNPYQEHDFGVMHFKEEKIYWKIDYFDKSLDFGSDDPADPTITTRVLTIMLAEEY